MSSYLDFLKTLLTLGPKLPDIFAQVQVIIAAVQKIIGYVQPEDGGLSAVDAEADTLEGQVAGLMVGGDAQAVFDPTSLRGIWQFLQANPWVLALVGELFKRAKG